MRTDKISNQAQVLVGFHAQGLVDFGSFSNPKVGLYPLFYRGQAGKEQKFPECWEKGGRVREKQCSPARDRRWNFTR